MEKNSKQFHKNQEQIKLPIVSRSIQYRICSLNKNNKTTEADQGDTNKKEKVKFSLFFRLCDCIHK